MNRGKWLQLRLVVAAPPPSPKPQIAVFTEALLPRFHLQTDERNKVIAAPVSCAIFSCLLQRRHLRPYDNLRRNLNKCWAQLEAKVTPTSDDLLTSNLFYSRITIVRNKKFEFEGILIIISILF